jgi:peptide/nickel transport system ATP-binding protein/oligopeptide transport system ATP-binding protein
MSDEVLRVKNLCTYFHTRDGVVPAVDGVSFSVRPGRTLGIVGESGCGKSVTSLSVMQLLPARSAEIMPGSSILLNGEELVGKSNRKMCEIRGNKISMIFQDSMTGLNPVLRIEKQMIESLRAHRRLSRKQARRRAVEILAKVGIPNPEARLLSYPHQLSGGMRQRVMIAMALSCEPDVLIADEPTTALDVTIQAQILELMAELKREINTAIILITHDMGVVAEMADEIMVMYTGQVVEQADTKSIFRNPKHPYTKGLLASIPRIDKKAESLYVIEGMVPNLYELPAGCKFAERCPHAMELCRSEIPQLIRVEDSLVRCFLYGEGGANRAG